MTGTEQRILQWLERADFNNTGCRHSQDTIARAIGCSREHVNRCTRTLAAAGKIRIEKERRPGLKWPCNVYHVRGWNPHKRSGVLNLLASIREARKAECHTERTAKPSRAQTPPELPSPHCDSKALVAREGQTHEGAMNGESAMVLPAVWDREGRHHNRSMVSAQRLGSSSGSDGADYLGPSVGDRPSSVGHERPSKILGSVGRWMVRS